MNDGFVLAAYAISAIVLSLYVQSIRVRTRSARRRRTSLLELVTVRSRPPRPRSIHDPTASSAAPDA